MYVHLNVNSETSRAESWHVSTEWYRQRERERWQAATFPLITAKHLKEIGFVSSHQFFGFN